MAFDTGSCSYEVAEDGLATLDTQSGSRSLTARSDLLDSPEDGDESLGAVFVNRVRASAPVTQILPIVKSGVTRSCYCNDAFLSTARREPKETRTQKHIGY